MNQLPIAQKRIWYYKEMEAFTPASIPKIAATGNFYIDIKKYCDEAQVALHPSFQEPEANLDGEINIDKIKEETKKEETKKEESKKEEKKKEEKKEEKKKDDKELPKYVSIFSKRIDKNSIKAMSAVLPTSKIEMIKYTIK